MLTLKNKQQSQSHSHIVPVEGGVVQKHLHADVLLQQAVSQDGHGGEADVVHGQIGRVIQGLGTMGAAGVQGWWGEQGGSKLGVNIMDTTYKHSNTTILQAHRR